MIASRVRKEVDLSSSAQGRSSPSEFGANNYNLKTVAILPVSRNVPIAIFARKLQSALESIGASTAYLNQTIISSHLGRHAFTRMGKLKASSLYSNNQLTTNEGIVSWQDGLLTKNNVLGLFYMWQNHL